MVAIILLPHAAHTTVFIIFYISLGGTLVPTFLSATALGLNVADSNGDSNGVKFGAVSAGTSL